MKLENKTASGAIMSILGYNDQGLNFNCLRIRWWNFLRSANRHLAKFVPESSFFLLFLFLLLLVLVIRVTTEFSSIMKAMASGKIRLLG